MFLRDRHSGHIIEILALQDLFNLYQQAVIGRDQVGEEVQDAFFYKKADFCCFYQEKSYRVVG